MADIVEVKNVSKSFDQRLVLDAVSLQVAQGSTTAIVGESGCGKTTLLQLINGGLTPESGSIDVFGAAVPTHNIEAFRRRMGFAVQRAALFPHLSCKRNVVLVAELEGWLQDRIDARFADLLAEMGLPEDVASRYPHEVSGGQQQRLGICRALMLAPELLLLDEPFSAVDPITRVGIYEQFEAVQQRTGVSVVLVTHDMREAVRLADQLMILRDGRVVQCAATNDVVNHPADDYVEFLVRKQL